MSGKKYIRIYKEYDVAAIAPHLLVYGELSGNCANCQAIDLKLDMEQCPSCGANFQYISFRNIKSHLAKLEALLARRPQITLVDYEDYARISASQKAKDFLT